MCHENYAYDNLILRAFTSEPSSVIRSLIVEDMPTGTFLPKMAAWSGFAEMERKRCVEFDIKMYMDLYRLAL